MKRRVPVYEDPGKAGKKMGTTGAYLIASEK